MLPITWSDVVAAAPELATLNATTQTDIVNYANAALNPAMFDNLGPIQRLATIMLAAHMGALAKLGTGGPLTGESDGRFSRSYAQLLGRSNYETTSYGRAYLSLIGPQAHGPQLL